MTRRYFRVPGAAGAARGTPDSGRERAGSGPSRTLLTRCLVFAPTLAIALQCWPWLRLRCSAGLGSVAVAVPGASMGWAPAVSPALF